MERAEHSTINVYENNLIQNILSSIEKHGGNSCLSSIILTGSFGRGEPTYAMDNDGSFRLKSDVEIALVFPPASKKEAIDRLIAEVKSEFSEDLNLMGINEKRIRNVNNFNFSFKVPKYKTLFTYDLYNGSKTIWGQDFIGTRNVRLSEVDLFEAKRLVANRIGELIYLQMSTEDEGLRNDLAAQWKGKLMLAIAGALLICDGSYVSSYHEQYVRIKAKAEEVNRQLGKNFFEDYEKAFIFLRENGNIHDVDDNALRNYVKNTDAIFAVSGISEPKTNSLSRIVKYLIKYVKSGTGYGIFNFEHNILQSLISDYYKASPAVQKDAEVWHSVLY